MPDRESVLLTEDRLVYIENQIDKIAKELPTLKEFILPGGSECVSRLHISRTSCRKAERSLVSMYDDTELNDLHAQYMNRLSDYLFLLARFVKYTEGVNEEHWALKK